MAHLLNVYNSKADFQSRVHPDFDRVVKVDENGDEHVVFEVVDYPKIQSSLGSFKMWTLQALVESGIDPRFGISTGFNTRLDGFGVVESAVAAINSSVDSNKAE